MRRLLLLWVVILVGLLLGACGGDKPESAPVAESTTVAPTTEPAASEPPGRALVTERCSVCHGVEKVYAEKRSAEEWVQVVDGMIAKGAKLSPDERTLVLDYLKTI